MKKEIREKSELLKDVFGRYKREGDEFLYWCPKCDHHKRKLSINFEKDCYKCWVCKFSGGPIWKLLRQYGKRKHLRKWKKFDEFIDVSLFEDRLQLTLKGEEEYNTTENVELPDGFSTLVKNQYNKKDEIPLRYLTRERGLTEDDIFFWKIGYCSKGKYKDRVIVPSFSNTGELNYFVARAYRENVYPKYLNSSVSRSEIVFNELMIDWNKDIKLVEGIFDAVRSGPNTIPLLNKTLSRDSELFSRLVQKKPDVYLALDKDAREERLEIAEELLSYGLDVYDVKVEPYDDVAEMTYSEFLERKQQSSKFDFNSLTQTKLEYRINE